MRPSCQHAFDTTSTRFDMRFYDFMDECLRFMNDVVIDQVWIWQRIPGESSEHTEDESRTSLSNT